MSTSGRIHSFPGAGRGHIFSGTATQPANPQQVSTPSQEEPQLGDSGALCSQVQPSVHSPHPGDTIPGISGTACPPPEVPPSPIHVICRPLKSRDSEASLRFKSCNFGLSFPICEVGLLRVPIPRAAVRMKRATIKKKKKKSYNSWRRELAPHAIGVISDYHSSNSPPGLPYSQPLNVKSASGGPTHVDQRSMMPQSKPVPMCDFYHTSELCTQPWRQCWTTPPHPTPGKGSVLQVFFPRPWMPRASEGCHL